MSLAYLWICAWGGGKKLLIFKAYLINYFLCKKKNNKKKPYSSHAMAWSSPVPEASVRLGFVRWKHPVLQLFLNGVVFQPRVPQGSGVFPFMGYILVLLCLSAFFSASLPSCVTVIFLSFSVLWAPKVGTISYTFLYPAGPCIIGFLKYRWNWSFGK